MRIRVNWITDDLRRIVRGSCRSGLTMSYPIVSRHERLSGFLLANFVDNPLGGSDKCLSRLINAKNCHTSHCAKGGSHARDDRSNRRANRPRCRGLCQSMDHPLTRIVRNLGHALPIMTIQPDINQQWNQTY
jgi:hypothetical protein